CCPERIRPQRRRPSARPGARTRSESPRLQAFSIGTVPAASNLRPDDVSRQVLRTPADRQEHSSPDGSGGSVPPSFTQAPPFTQPPSFSQTPPFTQTPPRSFPRRALLRTAGVAASATTLFGPSALSGPAPAAAVPRRSPVLPDPGSITATDPALLSALEAVSLLRSRALHPRELLDACPPRSAEHDGEINSWVHVYPETAHAQAEAAATRLAAGNAPLLCGLPVGVKDLYALEGLPLTADSRILEHNIASGDATVCRKLRDNGAILMGHARLDEFALLTATPQVGNPWNIADTVGGSSGGSAAVLAARFAPLALGTDTGGSVRLPASRCGISSIKPTYGRCSTYGIIPVMWTRDHPAPMGRSLADAALLLSFMAGPDGHDPATTAAPPPAPLYPLAPRPALKPLAGKVFGVVA